MAFIEPVTLTGRNWVVLEPLHRAHQEELLEAAADGELWDLWYTSVAGPDAVAQYVVAQRYETGKGTEKNLEKAFYWYEKAADQRYPLALVKLEEQKKQQAKAAEPVPAAKPAAESPVPTRAPKEARVKTEPAKRPVAPQKEPEAKAKANPLETTPA